MFEDKKKEKHEEGHEKKSEVEMLEGKIEELEAEKAEVFERLQRVSADYANFQKRTPKQIADTVAYEKERTIKALLPVLDNFEHMLASIRAVEGADDIVKGVEITYDHALEVLTSLGVEKIDAIGEKFDPSVHQAMMRRDEPDKEADVVLEVFQKGYKLNGRVIRPSSVIVNKPCAPQVSVEDDQVSDDESNDIENESVE